MLDCAAREIDAMRLMLLRHARSEKAEAGMRDHARRLNARGKSDAPVIGAFMAHHALIPDLVLVSTAERTPQTWERVAAGPATPRRARQCSRRRTPRRGPCAGCSWSATIRDCMTRRGG